jgi:putative membrane protein
MGWWMAVWWLAGLAVLILIVWMVTRAAGRVSGQADESPEQILKRRYARGEIDREEYQRRLTDIRR